MSVICRRVFLRNLVPSFYRKKPKRRAFSSLEALNSDEIEKKLPHIPVLLKEVVENLNLKEGNLFLDMTFGAGGHTEALLKTVPNLQVYALDRDPTALEFAAELQKKYPGQVTPLEGRFSELPILLYKHKLKANSFHGMLFDLGCSSMQFDTAERGFSINKNGPLDMRMDGGKTDKITAADVIAYAEEDELRKIFKTYGGEKKGAKLAQAIVQARAAFKPLKTTQELSDLIETVLAGEVIRYDKLKRETRLATKAFKALRAFVNNEINELNYGVMLAHVYLKPGGRAAVISFDSSEDQVVKRHFQNYSVDNLVKPLPLVYLNPNKNYLASEINEFCAKKWERVNKKVIVPSKEEVLMNARSRSAKLRVAIKLEPEEEPKSDESLPNEDEIQ